MYRRIRAAMQGGRALEICAGLIARYAAASEMVAADFMEAIL